MYVIKVTIKNTLVASSSCWVLPEDNDLNVADPCHEGADKEASGRYSEIWTIHNRAINYSRTRVAPLACGYSSTKRKELRIHVGSARYHDHVATSTSLG